MINIEYLQELLVVSIALSVITCTLIQKTKINFSSSKYIPIYSLLINMLIGIIFCLTFTNISFPTSLWVGFFSFLGADTIYKTLEGKLLSYREIITKNSIEIPKENIINGEDDS